ncbi:MAG: O-acetylhomoserine sulfhydrylase / O-succinylhomoserine sulfhydrylase [uncultured Cytophagales bacterium]|uniref:O-acetylhomoserine sulfhydrylase / O-succinylhomoserine sulfhydrylase n=1 Tax=uncultured Cytophagales bacterium TaxID=158755 RepID=A0A6J4LPL1_9SPHI|nr:MAG: O-acetylhomoserine sulfhydrylase / O-succinylhomoserine sulfhydrylase [uncultured Cytophagales bacterium]
MDLSYILNELGEDRELYFNAVAPPIVQTSNFAFPGVAQMRAALKGEYHQHAYSRGNNPTVEMLRRKLAALEGAEDALVFASGSAAIAATLTAHVRAGDHVVSVAKPYSWTAGLMRDWLPRFGVSVTFVDGTQLANFEEALRPETRVIYLESPNSFTFEMQDLAAVAGLAKARGIVTMVDNSYASPLYQQPLAMGIDLVLHSASKYLGGHSDVVAGVVCGSTDRMQQIFAGEYMTFGAIIAPLNAWLLLRGLRTLPLRLERSGQTARQVMAYLETHPRIERVIYPLLPSHPQYELARRQMKGAGGLFTVALATDSVEEVEGFCNRLKRFLLAVSWGGHESLVFPACASFDPKTAGKGTAFNLVRLYVGLEEPEVLIADLEQALKGVLSIEY